MKVRRKKRYYCHEKVTREKIMTRFPTLLDPDYQAPELVNCPECACKLTPSALCPNMGCGLFGKSLNP